MKQMKFSVCSITLLLFMMVMLNTTVVTAAPVQDPLLQVLIKKGILTEQEALDIRKEADELERAREAEKEIIPPAKTESELPKGLRNLSFGMLAYLDYSAGESGIAEDRTSSYNRFSITRGYFTVKKKINSWLGARITYDVHQDDAQDWKVRLKYLYAEIKPADFAFFTNMKAEAGMGHMPWLDYEEHINPYRCQGTMAMERAHVFNSADLGISIRGNFGGRLDDAEHLTGNHHYDGRWGSWHVGVYNGGGYHATENNGNKVVEGRISIRPLPDLVPGLKLNYFGLVGEGNTRVSSAFDYPDYNVNLGMLSYESPGLIVTTQYFITNGNASGA